MSPAITEPVVSDAGPLIALARIGRLGILRRLFSSVVVPPAVASELDLEGSRPGARALASVVADGWLAQAESLPVPARLSRTLAEGEAEAIALAAQAGALLLIDERRGRSAARRAGIRVIGTCAVLVAAKGRGLLPTVEPVLQELIGSGYRLSPALVHEVLVLAAEE